MDLQDLRAQIFAANDVPTELVTIPEWGVTVEVRGMTQAAKEQFIEQFGESAAKAKQVADAGGKVDAKEANSFSMFLLTTFVFNPNTDDLVFNAGDIPEIRKKASKVIDLLVETAMRLSGIGQKAVDEAGKSSSAPGSTETTGSDSQPPIESSSSGSTSETDGADPSQS